MKEESFGRRWGLLGAYGMIYGVWGGFCCCTRGIIAEGLFRNELALLVYWGFLIWSIFLHNGVFYIVWWFICDLHFTILILEEHFSNVSLNILPRIVSELSQILLHSCGLGLGICSFRFEILGWRMMVWGVNQALVGKYVLFCLGFVEWVILCLWRNILKSGINRSW